MTELQSTKRSSRGLRGIRLLLVAGSITVTLGGWGALVLADAKKVSATQSPVASAASSSATTGLYLPPIPTVVPPPPLPMVLGQSGSSVTAPQLRVVQAPPPAVTVPIFVPTFRTRSSR